jgi:hypothetical protein
MTQLKIETESESVSTTPQNPLTKTRRQSTPKPLPMKRLVEESIRAQWEALTSIARVVSQEEYIQKHPPQHLAELYEQIFEAAKTLAEREAEAEP